MVDFRAAGDAAVIAEFGTEIEKSLSRQVFGLYQRVRSRELTGVVACIPAFSTLLVQFDPLVTDGRQIVSDLRSLAGDMTEAAFEVGSTWRIPVCYDPAVAPDLASVALAVGLSPAEFISIHSSQLYTVYMLGGFPGYPFLGDVPESIRVPRRTSPRVRVEPGSVAVAGRLSAIYPMPTPGGWNLVGRTPLPIFDPELPDPALLSPGDDVLFEPISKQEFDSKLQALSRSEFNRSDFRARSP